MSLYHNIIIDLFLISICTFLEHQQILSLICQCQLFHGFNMSILELKRYGWVDQRQRVFTLTCHDLGKEHKLKCQTSIRQIIHGPIAFKAFIEVRICSIVVLFVCSNKSTHHINLSLDFGDDINRVDNSLNCSESCLWLGDILKSMIHFRFNQLGLDQKLFIFFPLKLLI